MDAKHAPAGGGRSGMMSRAAVVACLVAVELAVAGEIVVSLRAFRPAESFGSRDVPRDTARGELVEGGAHRRFAATGRPVLDVDVGYADLTIRVGDAASFDVSLAASTSHGMMRSKSPIAARVDRDTLHVAIERSESWTSGDDRMVSVVVPPLTRVVVRNAGNIDAEGLRADATLHSLARGTVTIEDYAASDLRVAATDGPVTLLGIDATRLAVSTGDGRIRARALRVRDGKIESEGGAVALAFAPGSDTSVTARTDSGAIRVAGDAADTTSASDDGSSSRVRLGAGEGRLDVRASDDVDLKP